MSQRRYEFWTALDVLAALTVIVAIGFTLS